MDFIERIKSDPRVVKMDLAGETCHFWYHRRCADLAKNHGYGEDKEPEDTVEQILRMLWMCHLTFNPDMPFDEFDMLVAPTDYERAGEAFAEIIEKQFPKMKESAATDDDDPPKKAKGRSKK